MSESHDEKKPGLPEVDMNEYGGKRDGVRQAQNRRLFMQVSAFDLAPGQVPADVERELVAQLTAAKVPSVVYADASAPRGYGVLTWAEDPAEFVERFRPIFASGLLAQVVFRPSFSMLGRTYSTGHEPELEFVLMERPIKNVQNADYGWHVWYPLRRTGAFAKLEGIEQSHIMREHASLGMAYGQQELAHDVRLACHGLDIADNEFVIGLVGRTLHPLSHLVQAMRKTRQTSEFIAQMGPFFVGRVLART